MDEPEKVFTKAKTLSVINHQRLSRHKLRRNIRYIVGTFMGLETINDIFLLKRTEKYAEIMHDMHVMIAVSTAQTVMTTINLEEVSSQKDAMTIILAGHIDRIISGSLQIRTYWKLAEMNGWQGTLQALLVPYVISILCLYMVDMGFINPKIGYTLAMVSLLILLWQIWRISRFMKNEKGINVDTLAVFFYAYLLYVIPYSCNSFEARDAITVALDGFERVGYVMVLAEILRFHP
jgi:hypothetical protein